jgi:hypothetical protein
MVAKLGAGASEGALINDASDPFATSRSAQRLICRGWKSLGIISQGKLVPYSRSLAVWARRKMLFWWRLSFPVKLPFVAKNVVYHFGESIGRRSPGRSLPL